MICKCGDEFRTIIAFTIVSAIGRHESHCHPRPLPVIASYRQSQSLTTESIIGIFSDFIPRFETRGVGSNARTVSQHFPKSCAFDGMRWQPIRSDGKRCQTTADVVIERKLLGYKRQPSSHRVWDQFLIHSQLRQILNGKRITNSRLTKQTYV